MKILVIPATNSENGMNRKLLGHATKLLAEMAPDAELEWVDINDFEMPIYSPAREAEGIPALATKMYEMMGATDAILFSFAEHNGSYTTAWKNIIDWATRIDREIFQGSKLVMLSATPGPMAGANVLRSATASAPIFGGELVGSMGVGKFLENFDGESGEVSNPELVAELKTVLSALA